MRAKAGKKRISTTVPEAEVEGFRAELGVVRSHCLRARGGACSSFVCVMYVEMCWSGGSMSVRGDRASGLVEWTAI